MTDALKAPPADTDQAPRQGPEALIEEARRRARRRRCAIASVAILILAVTLALVEHANRAENNRAPARSSSASPSTTLALLREPYLGVFCQIPNSIQCDAVGMVIQLRQPAASLSVAVSGRPMAMRRPTQRVCAPDAWRNAVCGAYFEGVLRPAGMLNGPLKVRPDKGRYFWGGRRPVSAPVRIVAHYSDGHTATTTRRVLLHPGYGVNSTFKPF